MIVRSHAAAVARFVRILSLTFVIALLVGFVAVQSFAGQYSATQQNLVVDAAGDAELERAISTQKLAGLTCREQPSLTDTVLFQRLGQNAVQVLRFDAAIAASAARDGWIRRYCV